MSLLHDVLKPTPPSAVDQVSAKLKRLTALDDLARRRSPPQDDSSDDELINVVSVAPEDRVPFHNMSLVRYPYQELLGALARVRSLDPHRLLEQGPWRVEYQVHYIYLP